MTPSAEAWPSATLVDSITRELAPHRSELGLVLGSGLGGIASAMHDPWVGDAQRLPGYPVSTVAGHHGRLLFGRLGGSGGAVESAPRVWVVQGRVHLYEGHAPSYATRYVRLLHALGVRTLVLTNAAGSVDTRVQPGDLVLADEAVSLFFRPLAAARDLRRGDGAGAGNVSEVAASCWRSHAALADPALVRTAEEVALEEGIALQRGVLVGSLGPTYETAAEVRAWRRLGGTVASMSTVPEAIQARALGMRVLLFSLVTNLGTGLSREPLRHEDVVQVADRAGVALGRLLVALAARLSSE
ncbi:MAG: purine-nucleoside phosphorylase [Candidatus Eisenbacteria bacterium]